MQIPWRELLWTDVIRWTLKMLYLVIWMKIHDYRNIPKGMYSISANSVVRSDWGDNFPAYTNFPYSNYNLFTGTSLVLSDFFYQIVETTHWKVASRMPFIQITGIVFIHDNGMCVLSIVTASIIIALN